MGKLTIKEIQNLKPKEKAYSLSDGEGLFIPNFAIEFVVVVLMLED